jgi:PKD repeat protein
MSILAKGFHSACLGLCAIAVFFLLMGTPAEVSAQQARGLFFAVFGQDAPPERGDYNHVQTIYIDIPITETRPIYLRIFDADVGGNLDERHGNFNSKTRFVLLGGNSAARTFEVRPDIRLSPYVNHNFPTEDIIHDRTFGVERSADGRYSVLGNLPPNRGYLTPDGYRRYVFLTMGIEGNDGNFFDFVISYDPNDKVEPANYRMFAYELTFRMPALRSFEGQIRIPVQDRQRIQVATFGLNGERAAIAIPSQEMYEIPSSTSDSWSIVPVDIANPSLISSIGFNFYGTTYTNVFSFMALDEEGKPIAIPLPIPDYEPVSEPVLRVTQSYAPDDCHVVHLERLIINGDNFLNPETEWQFASDTLRGDRLERRFDEKGYHPFTLQVSGTLNGNQSFFAVRDSVFINTPPSAWAGGNRAFVVGRPMAFDGTVSEDPDGRISRYFWDFGDGNTAMGARVDHTFTRAGTYTVTLRVLDDSNSPCNEATATAIVSVNRPPIARISAPAFAEPGETVVLDGSASEDPDGEIIEYQWVIGADSVLYGPLVEFIAWQARSIPITLTVIDNSFSQNSTGTARHTIGMSTRPIARAGNDKHVSPNRPATFVGTSSSAESGRIVRYEWIFPGNIIVEGATVQQGIADPGDHYVYLRVTDSNGGTDTDSLYVRVNFPPVPVITGNRILTDGRAVLSARDSFDPDGEIIRYEWNMGDGRRITGPDATHTYRSPGRYTVTLNIADNSGTFSSRQSTTTEVVVNQLPIARINAPGTGTAGQTLSFDGSASADPDGSIIRHIWDFGDGKDPAEIRGRLARQIEHAVNRRLLEEEGRVFAAGGGVVEPPPIVPRQPPLAAAARDFFHLEAAVSEAVALVFVGDVDPVVQVPDQAARLVLHVAAARAALEDFHLFVGNAIAGGVAVSPQVEGVGDADHDAVVEWQDHARQQKIIDENAVLVINAVAIGVLMAGHAALRLLLAIRVGGLHVGAHFHHVEDAIAIEGTSHRLGDIRVAQDQLQ